MITIKNLSKRTVVLNLPHDFACSESECTCTRQKVGVVDHDKVTGDRKVRAINRRLGGSVTIFPRGMKDEKGEALDVAEELLDQVVNAPDVQGAVARGEIEIVRVAAEPAPATPEAQPAPAPTPAPSPPAVEETTKTSTKKAAAAASKE